MNSSGVLLKVNSRAWQRTFLYSEKEIVGKNIRNLIYNKDRGKVFRKAIALLKENSSSQFEVKFLAKDGSIVSISCILKLNNDKSRIYFTGRDVTEKKLNILAGIKQNNSLLQLAKDPELFLDNLDEALKKINEVSAEILNVSRVSIWFYNKKRSNMKTYDLFERDNFTHSSGVEISSTDFPGYFKALESERVIDANSARTDARTCEFKDSYLIPLGIHSMLDAPVFFRGKSVGVLCHENTGEARVWSDQEKNFASSMADFISICLATNESRSIADKLKIKNKELKKINRDLDHFVYSSSHQLRAPLSSILGLINLIKTDDHAEKHGSYLDHIERSVSRLDETIREINSYYKNLRTSFGKEPIDFHSLITQVWADLNFFPELKYLTLDVDIQLKSIFYSDKYRFYELFSNLFTNSIKYRDPKKTENYIRVNITETAGGIKLIIEDNGIGIEINEVKRVFDIFYRATNRAEGSGLGLYIVKEIVRLLKGKISLKSEYGEFTRFTLLMKNYNTESLK